MRIAARQRQTAFWSLYHTKYHHRYPGRKDLRAIEQQHGETTWATLLHKHFSGVRSKILTRKEERITHTHSAAGANAMLAWLWQMADQMMVRSQ